jgi:hypothetical protein
MLRRLAIAASATLLISACGGGSSAPQAQTEEAAIEAATKAVRGTFVNRSGDVIDFMNEECRSNVDTGEIKQALALAQVFFQSDDYDIADIEVTGTVEDFTPEAATVVIELITPEGADDLGFLTLGDDEVDVFYENGKWVGTDCDFEDTTEREAEDLQAALDELGVSGTQDDPAPADLAVPIGEGFTLAITGYTPDAAAMIEDLGGSAPYLEDGETIALLEYDIAYSGDEEPASLNDVQLQLVGADGVGVGTTGCGNMNNQTYYGATDVFSGGSRSVVTCFAATPDAFPATPIVSVSVGFSDRSVYFDAATPAAEPTSVVASTGPAPDGSLTADRTDPSPIGTPVDIGEGWTFTVNGANFDADAEVLAASDFNDPAPEGQVYVLVDATIAYDGGSDGEAGSLFSVDVALVGDSNVAADDQCSVSSLDGELDLFADVFPGGSTSGTLCFLADAADTASLVAYATGEIFSDDYEFFALR